MKTEIEMRVGGSVGKRIRSTLVAKQSSKGLLVVHEREGRGVSW